MSPSAISTSSGGERNGDGILSLGGQLDGTHLSINGRQATHSNGTSPHFTQTPPQNSEEILDLLCIGFGPASLAIAIAHQDSLTSTPSSPTTSHPKILFLEKQPQFAWHAGMQLPGAKMQISFLKDLATPRNPRSKFTFINYLFEKGRLNQFINLGTFLPSRMEYEDYLRWCAGHFEGRGEVGYGYEVEEVRVGERGEAGEVVCWEVSARRGGERVVRRARNVVVAVGGRPVIPEGLRELKGVLHSSMFAREIGEIEERVEARGEKLRFAVVGSGQSAAEIFNDLWERFPGCEVRLVVKGASLRPSDDSPFVNEIFDPDRVDSIFSQPPQELSAAIALDRGTNYGVVRLSLLEHLYEKSYMQRLQNPDSSKHRCQILTNRQVTSASQSKDGGVSLRLGNVNGEQKEEVLDVDYVFAATGYVRNAHEEMLEGVRNLLGESEKGSKFEVGRDYRVKFGEGRVGEGAGIWLQGCCEGTHGLSDTLLSILAVRGGELVESIFGGEKGEGKGKEVTTPTTESDASRLGA